jgi:hypothetical protein
MRQGCPPTSIAGYESLLMSDFIKTKLKSVQAKDWPAVEKNAK